MNIDILYQWATYVSCVIYVGYVLSRGLESILACTVDRLVATYRRWEMQSLSGSLFSGSLEGHDRCAKCHTYKGRKGTPKRMTHNPDVRIRIHIAHIVVQVLNGI